MSWPKKPKTLKGCQARIEGLDAKRKELTDDLERVERRVEKHQHEVQGLLGASVLGDHPGEIEKELGGAKKLLGAALEREADIKFQIEYVDWEIENLAQEVDEATVREVPGELENLASEFNQALDTAMGALPVLKALHAKAQELESMFQALSNARQNALSRLGKTEGMNLGVGVGEIVAGPQPSRVCFSGTK